MATYKEIFEAEKQRDTADKWNIIHLFKEGTTYHAYEWSGWLCREFATTEEWRKQTNISLLKPTHKAVSNSSGSIIFVGFPLASLQKFVPDDLQMSFAPVSDTQIDVAVELPAELGEMTFDNLNAKFQEWKQSWPLKPSKSDKEQTGSGKQDDRPAFLAGSTGERPMRMSDIVAEVVALPLADMSPNDAMTYLRLLRRKCAALF